MLYNDDVNVPAVMRAMDVPKKAAEQYSFFGCGEYMLAAQSIGTPNTALNVAKVLDLYCMMESIRRQEFCQDRWQLGRMQKASGH